MGPAVFFLNAAPVNRMLYTLEFHFACATLCHLFKIIFFLENVGQPKLYQENLLKNYVVM